MSPQELIAQTGRNVDPVIIVREEEFGEFLDWASSYNLRWYHHQEIIADNPEAVAKKEGLSFCFNNGEYGFRLEKSVPHICVNHAPVSEYKRWIVERIKFFKFEDIADPVKTVRGITESDFDDIGNILNNM